MVAPHAQHAVVEPDAVPPAHAGRVEVLGDHDRMRARLAAAVRPGAVLELQRGGEGNIARVRDVIDTVARDAFPELVGWSPWVFASRRETERACKRLASPRSSAGWKTGQRILRTSNRSTMFA
jgi:hypothetical protein